MRRFATLLAISIIAAAKQSAIAFDEVPPLRDETASFQVEEIASGLNNPTGLAVRPTPAAKGPYELVLAESGAGRVLRIETDKPKEIDQVIVDFPIGTLELGDSHRVGPLALAFLARTKLMVSSEGGASSPDRVATYTLRAGAAAIDASQLDHAVGPMDQNINPGLADLKLCGLALSQDSCFVGSTTVDGGIFKCDVAANRLEQLRLLIDVKAKADMSTPGGIALIPEPRPGFAVAALIGTAERTGDSRLVFFTPSSGEIVLDLPTGLHDIIGLAYSPSGQLYAADFSANDEQAGGIFRIDDAQIDGRQTCQAVKIAALEHPFSLAFAPDGSLFVTAFGPGANQSQGKLVRIIGDL